MREGLAIGFPGGTYNHLFYVADVDARGAVMNGELHGALDTTDFLIVFPLKDDGRARLIGTVRTDAEHQGDESVVGRRESARDRVDAHRRSSASIGSRRTASTIESPISSAKGGHFCSATRRISTALSAGKA